MKNESFNLCFVRVQVRNFDNTVIQLIYSKMEKAYTQNLKMYTESHFSFLSERQSMSGNAQQQNEGSQSRKKLKKLRIKNEALLETCMQTQESLKLDSNIKNGEFNESGATNHENIEYFKIPLISIDSRISKDNRNMRDSLNSITSSKSQKSMIRKSMNLSDLINIDLGYDQTFNVHQPEFQISENQNQQLAKLSEKFIKNLDIITRQTEELIAITQMQITKRETQQIQQKIHKIQGQIKSIKLNCCKSSRMKNRRFTPDKFTIKGNHLYSPQERDVHPLKSSQKFIQSSQRLKEPENIGKTDRKNSHLKTQCDSNIPSLPSAKKISPYSHRAYFSKSKNMIKKYQLHDHFEILKEKKAIIQKSIYTFQSIFSQKAQCIEDQIKIYKEEITLVKKIMRSYDFSLKDHSRSAKILKAKILIQKQNSPQNRMISKESKQDLTVPPPESVNMSKKYKLLNLISAQRNICRKDQSSFAIQSKGKILK